MSKNPVELLKHIHDECSYILAVTGTALKPHFPPDALT
jgi:hypothetical protein